MSKKGKDALLLWCKRTTEGYPNVDVKNFHTSWADGLAFCAIIHFYRPDLIKYDELKAENRSHNLTLAFKVAESLGIPPLLDVEDIVDIPKPEQFSIITYLSQFYHHFSKMSPGGSESVSSESEPAPSGPVDCCAKCGKELEGPVIEVMGKAYHQECFGCFDCGKQLTDKCLNVNNHPYCESCGKKAFVQSKKKKPTPPPKNPDMTLEDKPFDKPAEEKKLPPKPNPPSLPPKEDNSASTSEKQLPTLPPKPSSDKALPVLPPKPKVNLAEETKAPPPLPSKPKDDLLKTLQEEKPKKPVLPPKPPSSSAIVSETTPEKKQPPILPPKPSTSEESVLDAPPKKTPPKPPASPATDKPPARLPPKPAPKDEDSDDEEDEPLAKEVAIKMSFRLTTSPDRAPSSANRETFAAKDLPNLEGMLEKKGDVGVIKSFKKRYFVLRKDRLIYYESSAAKEQDNPIGYVPLNQAVSFEKTVGDKKGGGFQITTRDPDRVWVLRAESEEEMEKWLNACIIHSRWTRATGSALPNPEEKSKAAAGMRALNPHKNLEKKEGFLDKLSGGMTAKVMTLRTGTQQWRPRWFVLKEGILWKYSNKNDPKPSGKIALYKCTFEEYNPESLPECTQFQVATKQSSYILRTGSVEEMHGWLNAILKQKLFIEQIIDNIELV